MLCERRFTTYEVLQQSALMVTKKDKRREPFSREKIHAGIVSACQKRPVSMEEVEEIVEQIERSCRMNYEKEVPSSVIGEEVIQRLRQLDQVAYVRFASVYREFQDVNTFMQEIKKLKNDSNSKKPPAERKQG